MDLCTRCVTHALPLNSGTDRGLRFSQESMSLEVQGDSTSFEGRGWTSYGFEYEPSEGKTGSIQWAINGTETWKIYDTAFGPSPGVEIGQRKVSVEPMSINLNLAMSAFISLLHAPLD